MKLKAVFTVVAAISGCLFLKAEDLPVEYFLKDPTFRSVKLSPKGTDIAVLVRYDGIMNLAVINLKTNKPQIITLEKQDISRYYWINNDRLIYMTDKLTDTELERSGGIFAVDKDGGNGRVLVVPPGGEEKINYNVPIARYLGPDPESDRKILVAIGERSRKYPDVYSIDIKRGHKKRVLLNEWNARGYYTDVKDEIRFAYKTELVGKKEMFFLNPETKDWELLTVLPTTGSDWYPIDFSPDRDTFLVLTDLKTDKLVIEKFNWKTRESELFYEDPQYDVEIDNWIEEIKMQDECVGIVYETERPKVVYFDKQHEMLQGMIDKALPHTFNEIVDVTEDGNKLMILASSDVKMPSYYMLDLKGFQLQELTNIAPWLDSKNLQPKMPISFEASDGATVHGYLILPDNYSEDNPVPLIVNPHGGPWARDVWRMRWYFDNEPQFYANRGFAVLQVNFRGSTGYGAEFFDQHKRNIGRMYADVKEGVEWAIQEGYAHPDRIGIAGASWGGYQTMLALVKDPEFFKFGINLFGMVDIVEHINTYLEWNRREAYNYWIEKFDDPSTEEGAAYLREWSPITYINRIKSPVFVYHGVRDYNVDIEQSRMLISALNRLDIPHEKVFDADEMHSLENPELRIRVYEKIDEFLKPFRKKWGLIE